MFARWARVIGREDFMNDPRLKNDQSRADHQEIITEVMKAWLANRTTAQAIAELEKARIPAGPVLTVDKVLEDPQVKARELLKFMDYPGAPRAVPLANTPVRLSETPGGIRHRAPQLGEHTDEILRELGYSEEEVRKFRAAEAV
jgi:crotonobetainyl-CoA:carnitine CoA-transferase CaiB-like acyl-CoA transferase